jgi:hypothetical protein
VTIFHFALPSPMTAAFARLPGAKILQYHNITPAAFFAPYDPGSSGSRRSAGRSWRRWPARRPGARRLRVQPAGARVARLRADRRHADRRQHGADHDAPPRPRWSGSSRRLVNILFVGRIVPNKKIEDHIRWRRCTSATSTAYYRFIFVGRYDGLPRYYAQVRR